MTLPPVLNSIVGWLKAGYPYGVPDSDYIPLLALLARRLTSEEVAAVAAELNRQHGTSSNGAAAVDPEAGSLAPGGADPLGGDSRHSATDTGDIGVLITKITNELPREEDVARVRAHLSASGPFL